MRIQRAASQPPGPANSVTQTAALGVFGPQASDEQMVVGTQSSEIIRQVFYTLERLTPNEATVFMMNGEEYTFPIRLHLNCVTCADIIRWTQDAMVGHSHVVDDEEKGATSSSASSSTRAIVPASELHHILVGPAGHGMPDQLAYTLLKERSPQSYASFFDIASLAAFGIRRRGVEGIMIHRGEQHA